MGATAETRGVENGPECTQCASARYACLFAVSVTLIMAIAKWSSEMKRLWPTALASAAFSLTDFVGEHDRIDSAGARCADAFEAKPFVLEQTIKYAPGERAVTAAALQRQVHNFGHLGSLSLLAGRQGLS